MTISMYSASVPIFVRMLGNLSAWRWGGIIATLVIEATLVFVTVTTVLDYLNTH